MKRCATNECICIQRIQCKAKFQSIFDRIGQLFSFLLLLQYFSTFYSIIHALEFLRHILFNVFDHLMEINMWFWYGSRNIRYVTIETKPTKKWPVDRTLYCSDHLAKLHRWPTRINVRWMKTNALNIDQNCILTSDRLWSAVHKEKKE